MGKAGYNGGAPEFPVYHNGEAAAAEGVMLLIALPVFLAAGQLPLRSGPQGGVVGPLHRGVFLVHPPVVVLSGAGQEALIDDEVIQHNAHSDGLRLPGAGFPQAGAQGIGVFQVKGGELKRFLQLPQGLQKRGGIHGQNSFPVQGGPLAACMLTVSGNSIAQAAENFHSQYQRSR